MQHLDSCQSAIENNVYVITEKLSCVQTEVTDTINQLNTTVIANQDSNTASQARLCKVKLTILPKALLY